MSIDPRKFGLKPTVEVKFFTTEEAAATIGAKAGYNAIRRTGSRIKYELLHGAKNFDEGVHGSFESIVEAAQEICEDDVKKDTAIGSPVVVQDEQAPGVVVETQEIVAEKFPVQAGVVVSEEDLVVKTPAKRGPKPKAAPVEQEVPADE